MAVSDYSKTPSQNVAVNGVRIDEGCPPGNLNDAMRQIMADIRVFYDSTANTGNFMPLAGGAFTGQITRQGRGGYAHFADPALASGRIFLLPAGGGTPTGLANGDIILEY